MTIGIFTILATTGLLVLLKLGIMALVVVLRSVSTYFSPEPLI